MNDDYLLGFLEGEGCFCIAIGKYSDRTHGIGLRPSFIIALAQKDVKVLKRIKRFLGYGRIYEELVYNKNSVNIARYNISNVSHLLKLKKKLEGMKFNTTKGEDFKNWSKCLEIIKNKEHRTKKGILKIAKLRDKMNTTGGKPVKRTYAEIKSIIELTENERKLKRK